MGTIPVKSTHGKKQEISALSSKKVGFYLNRAISANNRLDRTAVANVPDGRLSASPPAQPHLQVRCIFRTVHERTPFGGRMRTKRQQGLSFCGGAEECPRCVKLEILGLEFRRRTGSDLLHMAKASRIRVDCPFDRPPRTLCHRSV